MPETKKNFIRFASPFMNSVIHSFSPSNREEVKIFLDYQADRFNSPSFIEADPISIPHTFTKKEDIEISGLVAAIFAWGQRTTILKKSKELIQRMDNDPHRFILHHSDEDLKSLAYFKHRTFNETDALFLVHFLKDVYKDGNDLEHAFFPAQDASENAVEKALIRFKDRFGKTEYYPKRSGKHISSPGSGSACKRLNMFLRWMVRKDEKGVDFGIWNSISPSQLICPCDVHVERNARIFGLVSRPKTDWKMALELTGNLRAFDPLDPVKYDFALFGLGTEK